jgi:hypothetical protein
LRLNREGWGDPGDARRELLDTALELVADRDGPASERLGAARLAADGGRATIRGAGVRARIIAARLARGDHEGAATVAAEQRLGGDAASRAGLDAVLFAVPALRRTGWPGCHGRTLALRHARAALAAAAHGQDPEPWLAPIPLHGDAGALPDLARALAAGDRAGAAAALAALPGDLPLEPWLAEVLPRCRRWAAGGPPPDLAAPPRDLLRAGPAVRTLVARWNDRGAEWGRFAPVPGEGGDDGRVAAALGLAQ